MRKKSAWQPVRGVRKARGRLSFRLTAPQLPSAFSCAYSGAGKGFPMLSLSLPRGFGLLIVCAPTYKRKPKKYKPLALACPTIKSDLLADARTLLASGHPTAAAMTARVEIERLLTTLAMSRKDFGPYWRGVHETAAWLRVKLVIRTRTHDSVIAANVTGNAAAHGMAVSGFDVGLMFNAIESLRVAVVRKVGAA